MGSRRGRRWQALSLLATLHAASVAGCASPRGSGSEALPLGDLAGPLPAPAAAICGASPSTEAGTPQARSKEKDIGARLSFYGWAPGARGDVTVDGYEGKTDGAAWGGAVGIAGEIRPRGWSATFDVGWAGIADDIGQRDVNPKFDGRDVDHLLKIVEVGGGPCLFDLPADGCRSDGLLGFGSPEGERSSGGSRFRIDTLLGIRWIEHTVDSDIKSEGPWEEDQWTWVNPIAGLRVEVSPVPGLAFHARGDAGAFGIASRTWAASASASVRIASGTWITAGWSIVSADHERGDDGRYRFNALLGGPFLSLDLWF